MAVGGRAHVDGRSLWPVVASSTLLCLCCGWSVAFMPGDVGPPPDPCQMDDTQSRVASTVLACLPVAEPPATSAADCDRTAECVARALARLTDECDGVGAETSVAGEGGCNKATASFVFVETFRRLASAARSPKHKCSTAGRLRRLVAPCQPAGVKQEQSEDEHDRRQMEIAMAAASGVGRFEEDGVDALVRRASVLLGGMEGVAGEMAALSRKRLLHGTAAIAVTFALPGVLAACSLAHARLVALVQLCCLGLVFFYVRAQHGLPAAVGVSTCCAVILLLEFGAFAYMAGRDERRTEGVLWTVTRKQHES